MTNLTCHTTDMHYFKIFLFFQTEPYLPTWWDCIRKPSTRADQCPSWWRSPFQKQVFPWWRLHGESSGVFSSLYAVSFPCLDMEFLLLRFSFGHFALLLSVSHSAWATAVCSNYMVGEGWESVRVSSSPPPLPQSTAPHTSVWLRSQTVDQGSTPFLGKVSENLQKTPS